jgi:predicted nucleic acid-binding protein
MRTYILDSNAVVAYFQKEKSWQKVQTILAMGLTGQAKILMSSINFGEYLYTIHSKVSEKEYKNNMKRFEALEINLINPDLEQVYQAVEFKNCGGIAYCDCFVLALAKKHKATIVTGDKEFKKFEKDFRIEWL